MSAGCLKAEAGRRLLAGFMCVFLCEHVVFSLEALLRDSPGPRRVLLRHFVRCAGKPWPQVSSGSCLLTKNITEMVMLSQPPLSQVYFPPHSRAFPPFQMIETPLMLRYSTVVLLHRILWIEKSLHPPKKSLRSPGGVTDLQWGGEGWLILISMHLDALHCLQWMHLAFLGIANVPPQRLCMQSITGFLLPPAPIMRDTVLLSSMFHARSPTWAGVGTLSTSTDRIWRVQVISPCPGC